MRVIFAILIGLYALAQVYQFGLAQGSKRFMMIEN